MSNGRRLEVDPQILAQSGGELARVASQIDEALSQLRGALGQHGAPWGNDEVGAPFGQSYTSVMQQAFTAITSYADQIGYAADRLPEEAQRLRDTEAGNVNRFWTIPDQP